MTYSSINSNGVQIIGGSYPKAEEIVSRASNLPPTSCCLLVGGHNQLWTSPSCEIAWNGSFNVD